VCYLTVSAAEVVDRFGDVFYMSAIHPCTGERVTVYLTFSSEVIYKFLLRHHRISEFLYPEGKIKAHYSKLLREQLNSSIIVD